MSNHALGVVWAGKSNKFWLVICFLEANLSFDQSPVEPFSVEQHPVQVNTGRGLADIELVYVLKKACNERTPGVGNADLGGRLGNAILAAKINPG